MSPCACTRMKNKLVIVVLTAAVLGTSIVDNVEGGELISILVSPCLGKCLVILVLTAAVLRARVVNNVKGGELMICYNNRSALFVLRLFSTLYTTQPNIMVNPH